MRQSMKQFGFTLIELMTAVVIIGVLVAIALPSYQRYIIKNAESEARARMGQLQTELERWRTTTLTYRGFTPMSVNTAGSPVYQYDNAQNTIIYVPTGSNASNYRYQIELVDGNGGQTLVGASGVQTALGRSWVMRATPNPDGVAGKRGHVYLQHSTGLRCATLVANANSLPITASACNGAGLETW